ncbi:MAG TPA: universal stress protein [Acidimicrobiia bacterium]|jgi:nucleotide-binding universal stress UspA family protein
MTPTVVAGIDLTSMGRRVADRARITAETMGGSLSLVHVLEPVGEAMIDPGLTRIMREHQQNEAEKLAAWVEERTSVPVDLEVVKGSPPWELVSRAKKADLIVLGSSAVDAFTVGPTSLRVARMAVSDVLVVRRQPRVPYRRIIAAVDFSESSRVAVERSLEMCPDAEVTVLFSLPSRFDSLLVGAGLFPEEMDAARETRLEAAEDRMLEFSEKWHGRVRTMVTDGPPAETIDESVRRRSADLVVVGSRGATATRMVLLGTVAEGLVSHAPCDVLVARSPVSFRRP